MPIVALFLLLLTVAQPAAAQAMCAARADLLVNLKGQFSEATIAVGLSNTGGVVEVLTSPDGDTWTLIVTDPQGISRLMAAGEAWERRDPPVPGEKT